MTQRQDAAGKPPERGRQVIEVRVAELRQLFNSIDPSPFGEKDLDPRAEEFIVGWARELPRTAALAFVVYLDRPAGLQNESEALGDALREFFRGRAEVSRRKLHQLFRLGRWSLLIGLLFLGASLAIGSLIERELGGRVGALVHEGLLIGGWVAMWRPLEIFLYDWWPIRADIGLYHRLSGMPVQIRYTGAVAADWRRDWPAAPAAPAAGGQR
jgi:hypothetical protein